MDLTEVVKAGKPVVYAEGVELLHQTEKAYKIELEGKEIWLPKANSHFVEDTTSKAEPGKKPFGTILVLDWAWKSKMEKDGLTMKPKYISNDDILKYL